MYFLSSVLFLSKALHYLLYARTCDVESYESHVLPVVGGSHPVVRDEGRRERASLGRGGTDAICVGRRGGDRTGSTFLVKKHHFVLSWWPENNKKLTYCDYSGYVRKYYDVKNRAFLQNCMRDFGHFYAQFLFDNHTKYITCKNRAFSMKNMRIFQT